MDSGQCLELDVSNNFIHASQTSKFLTWPRIHWLDIRPACSFVDRLRYVDSVEGGYKIVGTPDLTKDVENLGLSVSKSGKQFLEPQFRLDSRSNFPHESLVSYRVAVIQPGPIG